MDFVAAWKQNNGRRDMMDYSHLVTGSGWDGGKYLTKTDQT
jgi:hypothetical protein